MAKTINAQESTAFTREGPGKDWADKVESYLRSHRGQLFTAYDLWDKLGKGSSMKRDSAISTISLRWNYAGFNDPDDRWLYIERTRLPNRAFAYKWVPLKRQPERTESPAEAKRRRDREKTERLAREDRERAAAERAERVAQLERERQAVPVAAVNGSHPEPEPTPEPQPIFVTIPDPLFVDQPEPTPEPVPAPKEGFDLGDLVEVIGFTKLDREPVVRDTAGFLYRITALEF